MKHADLTTFVASFSDGSYLMTPLRVSSVAAVTQPAGRAPGEELRVYTANIDVWGFFSFLFFPELIES